MSKAECCSVGTSHVSCFSVSITDSTTTPRQDAVIRIATVTFRHSLRGWFQGRLDLVFNDPTGRPILFIRQIRAIVGNADDRELLRGTASYVQRQPAAKWYAHAPTVEGRRPPALDVVQWVKPLPPSHCFRHVRHGRRGEEEQ
ncbi:hypothetical protein FKP32DRAFT_1759584, partial [Trametes sanguinea]